ncbi:hypothetical protein GBA52_016371 [Prunus armeniaca]|nr:hypothetical protein GBA52_016371 [Prunus armeniaca]
MGNNTEFQSTVIWLSENLMLVDARVNLVECNIRVLGGLVSGHLLATDSTDRNSGSLILEMGALSQLTGDPKYESAALRALVEFTWYKHWMYQLGNGLNIQLGLGLVGVDSFYEYLFKARILFEKGKFWRMFHSAYIAVQEYFRHGPRYSTIP